MGLLKFDDAESKYKGIKGVNSKQHTENFSIIFSRSYNGGENCIGEACTPYVIAEDNGDFVASAKENWERHFPTVVMLQRNMKVTQSTLEKFLLQKKTRGIVNKATSSTNISYSNGTFESFMSETENDVVINEVGITTIANDKLSEYTLVSYSSQRFGSAVVKGLDSTEKMLEFDMDLTTCQARDLKGVRGTHQWKAYQEMSIDGKIDIKVGDSIVVVGIADKGRIHIVDPAYRGSMHDMAIVVAPGPRSRSYRIVLRYTTHCTLQSVVSS